MLFFLKRIFFIILIIFFVDCNDLIFDNKSKVKYIIGFSQCTSGDLWRKQMNFEMELEVSFHPEVQIIIKDGQAENEKQIKDIEEFIKMHIDLLIVSPNEAQPITPVVEKAYDAGIPIVLIDRKINSEKYTAYIGADNFKIGYEAGEYAKKILNRQGTILEIWGLKGSTPAQERHDGFRQSILKEPKIRVLYGGDGKWLGDMAENLAETVFSQRKDIDLVFAHNDVMALGAYRAAKRHGLESKMYFIGIDALPGEQGGVQMVLDKILNASLLYPTGGEEAIRLALKILNGQSFLRENILQTVLVDSSNARILRMQYNQILEHQKKIKAQQKVLERQLKLYKAQKMRFYLALLGLIIVLLVVSFLIRAYLLIRRINNELEEKNRKIEKQRKEITHQRDLLKTMHEKAEQAHRLKIQFFTNVSHEFRTPLTLILGTIDRLENNLKNINAQNSILLSLLKKNSKHLLKLVNQLLDFRKLEEGKLKLYAEYDNIIPFLENIASTFEILAVWKEIDYRFIAEQKEINVWFDKEKLDKTMFNLISNAFKFTPNKGQIEIIVKKEEMQQTLEKSVAISVIDTGIGIPNNEIDHIFEPFYVIHEHSRTHSVSSGIGLALCKSYVEMHHGQILVESEIGKGTAFTIYLPLGDGHLSTEEKFLSHSGEAKIVEPLIELEAEPFELIEKTFTNLEISHKKDKKIILVVEDNQDTRNFLRLLLETEYEIIEAKDGQVGLNKARRLVPDLIITDIMMPKMDGIEMSKQIRNDLRISHIPILMLTAKSSDESRLESYQTGADAFLSKPFNEKILKARIENLLETRKRLRKLFQKNPMTFLQDESMKVQEKSFFEKVVELIEQNLDNSSFSVDQLGQEIGFTRVHLYRKIKALTGKTPSEFIRNYRLQKAADLLKNTDLNISEVAYRVGFESPSYFSKCFHEMFNCTPSEFINNKTE